MGPTGSGKSAMALAIAASRPTVIINADAMQMVNALRVLTARPTLAEETEAEHALYGVLHPTESTSVARWLELVEPIISNAFAEGKLPLLVGGTGMYIKALMEGLARIPPVPEDIRQKYRNMLQVELHPALATYDSVMAETLKPGDTQRLIRALEVFEATGKSLAVWQQQTTTPLFPTATYHPFFMDVDRDETYRRINHRFDIMFDNGALDEVRDIMQQNLDPALPILRAHGVPELSAYLNGTMLLDDALDKSKQNTRNYAKRQLTWLRNQMPDAKPAILSDLIEL